MPKIQAKFISWILAGIERHNFLASLQLLSNGKQKNDLPMNTRGFKPVKKQKQPPPQKKSLGRSAACIQRRINTTPRIGRVLIGNLRWTKAIRNTLLKMKTCKLYIEVKLSPLKNPKVILIPCCFYFWHKTYAIILQNRVDFPLPLWQSLRKSLSYTSICKRQLVRIMPKT